MSIFLLIGGHPSKKLIRFALVPHPIDFVSDVRKATAKMFEAKDTAPEAMLSSSGSKIIRVFVYVYVYAFIQSGIKYKA